MNDERSNKENSSDQKRRYKRLNELIRRSGALTAAIPPVNIALTVLGYIAFPVLVLYLLYSQPPFYTFRTLLVCAGCFAAVTLIRNRIDRPRPYISQGYQPIIYKISEGRSMPSRHVASCFIIAFAWYQAGVVPFVFMLSAAFLLALVRVLGGVHYLSDVISSALGASLLGYTAFILL